jgi:hypothetical protein
LSAILWIFSRGVLTLRPAQPLGSFLLGVLAFVLWVGPDWIAPGYRQHWLFQNSILGSAPTPEDGYKVLPPHALAARVVRAVVLVPIIEELFWRAWLMRWLINPNFLSVPLGAYAPQAFAITAALFAVEHGSFWLVGLIAGVLYNWWMVRTRSLADCILAHAVTNGLLCGYVLAARKWEYW